MANKTGLLIIPLLLLLLLSVDKINSFNLDTENFVRHEGQKASLFGFSVALHQENERKWVIIGAPRTDTSSFQPNVSHGGAVYRCDISGDNGCHIIMFDKTGNNFNEQNEQIDTKSNQWFGATVASAGIDGPLVACAPRYIYHQQKPSKVERNEPVGTCFLAKNGFQEFQEFSPCRTRYWGYHRQGICEAGFSAALSVEGDRLYIGAPGSWYSQGQIYSINSDAVYPFAPSKYEKFGGEVTADPKDKVYSTKESSSKEDDSYLGYSSTTGNFNGDGQQGVAVGMPHADDLLGKVLIFSWDLKNQQNITGEQMGAYFGYSLCAIDVDGDKLDDLIIGAPMHTEPNNEGKYETGKIYIIYQGSTNKFREVETRAGATSKGRFGLSLAALGDINLDGYGDFAVGAPYDGPNGRGAVYIFHGSAGGPLEKPSQVIYAEDVAGTHFLSTFGFSIAGGIDLDNNMYPDMVVGAYESNSAYVFKSRPVAVMEAHIGFESENKLISLDNKNCILNSNKKQVACTTVSSCLRYNGVNVPETIVIEISWVLDSKKTKTPRMFFIKDETKNILNSTMRLYRGKEECPTHNVYIAEGIKDKLTPLEVEMKYNIRHTTSSYTTSTLSRRVRSTLEPVLDENRGTIQRDSINIMKNCGPDNICVPDLKLNIETNEKYILGGNESLSVNVYVNNDGEDAFESTFYMTVPQGLDYKSIKKIGENRDTSYTCSPPSALTNYTLKCDIGNPLPARKAVSFQVVFEPSKKAGITPFYDFYMEANSTNEESEQDRSDNVYKKSVAILIESDLTITGSSKPPEVHYNISQYKEFGNLTNEAEIGPLIVHVYDIRNNGTSTIDEIEIFINWPAMTLDKEPLMYLLSQPEYQGLVRCDPSQFVNPENIIIDQALERKSYLDSSRQAIRTSGFQSSSSSSSRWTSTRYNTQGGVTLDEKHILDRDDSREATGDASLVHADRNRFRGSGQYESSQVQYSSGTVTRGRGSGSTRITSETASSDDYGRVSGGNTNFDWNSQGSGRGSFRNRTSSQGHVSGQASQGGSASFDSRTSESSQSGRSGSTFVSNRTSGSSRGGSGSSVSNTGSRIDSSQSSSNAQGSGYGSNIDLNFIGSNVQGRDGGNVREYEYHEQWNSSSVNGGPAVTHYSSQNQTFNRGQGGRVLVSETSTETVITGGVGHSSWGTQGSSHSENRFDSQSASQSDLEYERQRQEYYESMRVYQEEQKRRQLEEHRRQLDEQKRAEDRRIKAELEQRQREEYERQLEADRRRMEEERRRYQSGSQSSTVVQSRQSGSRQGGGNRQQSGQSSSSTSSSFGTGSIDTNFDENVHQDISSQSGGTHIVNAQNAQTHSSSSRRRFKSQQDGEPPRPDLVTGVTQLEKVAQGGRGLQTVGLDLGVLSGRNNVDEEMRRQGSSGFSSSGSAATGGGQQHSSSSSYSTQYSSGSRAGSTGGYSSHTNLNQASDDDYEDEEEYDGDGQFDDDQSQGYSHTSRTSQSYTYQSDLDRNSPQFKHYRRTRDVTDSNGNKPLCEAAHCVNLRCTVGPLEKNTGALIALRMRLAAHTLHKLGGDSEVKLSTMAIGKVTKLPYVGTPPNEILKSQEVFVKAIPDSVPKPDVIPLWIFVLAACAGALILLLLVYLLYKCGFFKRNRPTGSPHERQPLNRNGNYHGDEHL